MARKIANFASLLLWIVIGCVSSKAFALGLGEIELKSNLNQPLVAEIQLRQTRNLTKQEVLAGLASQKDFESAGVDRPFLVTQLRFDVVINTTTGSGVIKVTTAKPIREPFLNFLVEVHWPAGRLLREYTVLLDPPVFDDSTPPVLSVPRTADRRQSSRTGAVQQDYEPEVDDQDLYLPNSGGDRGVADDAYDESGYESDEAYYGESYTVEQNDTLGSIASRIKPPGTSINQVMIAIQRNNPNAFIEQNINLIKAGEVLRLPSDEEIGEVSRGEAIEEVRRQMDAWRGYTSTRSAAEDDYEYSSPQLKSSESSITQDESEYESGGVLRLHSAASEGDGSATGDGVATGASGQAKGNVGTIESRLLLAEEELEKGRLRIEDLNQQVAELADQIETSTQLVKLKDEQLAALKAKLADLEQQRMAGGDGQSTYQATIPDMGTQEGADMMQDGMSQDGMSGSDQSYTADEMYDGDMMDDQSAMTDDQYGQAQNDGLYEDIDGEAGMDDSLSDQDGGASQSSSVIDMLTSPLVIGGLAALLVLIMVGFFLAKRGGGSEEDDEGDLDDALNEDESTELDVESADETLMSFNPDDETILDANDETMVEDLSFDGGDETLLSMDEDSDTALSMGDSDTGLTLDEDSNTALTMDDETVLSMDDETEISVDDGVLDDDPADMILLEEDTGEEDDVADLLGEADIYIAYGRFDQSLDLLQKALAKAPKRVDVHAKIMDVYSESASLEGFKGAAHQALALEDDRLTEKVHEVAQKLGEDLGGEFEAAAPSVEKRDNPVTHSGVEKKSHPVAADSLVGDDDDLDFDLDLDEGLDVTQLVAEQDDMTDLVTEEDEITDLTINEEIEEDTEVDEVTLEDLELGLTSEGADNALPSIDDLEASFDDSLDEVLGDTDSLLDEDLSLDTETESVEQVEEAAESVDESLAPSEELSLEGDDAAEEDLSLSDTVDSVLDGDDVGEADSLDELGMELDLPVDESPVEDSSDVAVIEEASADMASDVPAIDAIDESPLADEIDTVENVESNVESIEPVAADVETAEAPAEEGTSSDDPFLNEGADLDEAATKLDLAKAYLDMGDNDGARDILDEVVSEGNQEQQTEAKALLQKCG